MPQSKNTHTHGEDNAVIIDDHIEWLNLQSYASSHNKVVHRNLNGRYTNPTFTRNTKDEIVEYIEDPAAYETELRQAVRYMYGASVHFKRLIGYFSDLTDFAFIISPVGYDNTKVKPKTILSQYNKTMKLINTMNLKTQCHDILVRCLREDIAYVTMHISDCNIIFQYLDPDYCKIATIEDGVFQVTFDFSYFDTNSELLEYYPKEFDKKYKQYLNDRMNRWIELDAPTSFAIKCNRDIPEYAIPPFAGLLRELYDLEDYKALKLSKTVLENYSLLSMKLPMDDDGNFELDLDRARKFWFNLNDVIPEEVGSVLTPMDIEQFDFQKSNTGDTDQVAATENEIFTQAGVSSLLFNNPKASANALALSIKVDQQFTYGIVKSIEEAINRYLHYETYSAKFRFTFLDVSPFNRKEMGDQYMKAAQYGLPTVMMFAASQGLSQLETDAMSWLENDVLDLKSRLIPLSSANTQSSSVSANAASSEGGRPTKDAQELTDSGEQTREDGDDW